MNIYILTLFPDFFDSFLESGMVKRAIDKGQLTLKTVNIRNFAQDRYGSVDDYPFGGGDGMVMRVDVIYNALKSIKRKGEVVLLSPKGEVLNQKIMRQFSKMKTITLICSRYKGVDVRVENFVDRVVSIGDFILSGGETAAEVLVDGISRLLPDVVGKINSVNTDSFEYDILEPPLYTRPREFMGFSVPKILLSGNHQEIERWKRIESIKMTLDRRPDIIEKTMLSKEDKKILKKLKGERKNEGNPND